MVVYETAYLQATSSTITDYGSLVLNIPLIDIDDDQVPDYLENYDARNITASGTGYSVPRATSFTTPVNMVRNEGQFEGRYTATVSFPGQPNLSYSGAWYSLRIYGKVLYARTDTVNTLNFELNSQVTPNNSGGGVMTGSTEYAVSADKNMIYYPEFRLVRTRDGAVFTVKAGSLNRTDKYYRGTVSLDDGIPETSWPDFTEYYFEVWAPVDTDDDGIPDITDEALAPPLITRQPISASATVGTSVTFSALAESIQNISYRWYHNGAPLAIAGADTPTLTIGSLKLADAGEYKVIASNATGSTTSNIATLNVSAGGSSPSAVSGGRSGGGGGGGGAPSLWMLIMLLVASVIRFSKSYRR